MLRAGQGSSLTMWDQLPGIMSQKTVNSKALICVISALELNEKSLYNTYNSTNRHFIVHFCVRGLALSELNLSLISI